MSTCIVTMQGISSLLPLFPRLSARPLLVCCSRSYGTRRESKPWKQKPNRKAKLALILTEDLPKLGSMGHVVRVEHGYGRNWLLPQGKAVYATPENMRLYGAEIQRAGGESEVDVAALLSEVASRHEISIPLDGDNELAIYEHHIAKALRRFRLHVPLDCIEMEEPLTAFGEHPVIIRVDESTAVPFTVKVVPKPVQEAEEDEQSLQHDHLPF